MAADRSTAELELFLAERADHLLRTAALLAGGRDAGEDLLQTAVERLLRRWRRFDGDPEGYLRRTLCNLAIDDHRRAGRWRQKERLLRTDLRLTRDPAGDVDLRDAQAARRARAAVLGAADRRRGGGGPRLRRGNGPVRRLAGAGPDARACR